MRSKASHFSLPVFLSVLAGVMFLFVLCLLVAGQPALSQYYQNLSLLSNLALWPIALAGVALLLWGRAVRRMRGGREARMRYGACVRSLYCFWLCNW